MYDYTVCLNEMAEFLKDYPKTRVFETGKSVMNRPIYCIKAGAGEKKLLLIGAHHGLEYLTSALIMRFLRDYQKAVISSESLFGYNPRELSEKITVFAVPMLNPDGVDLAIRGIDIRNNAHRRLIQRTGLCKVKKRWQANANGVDINHNYDADFKGVKLYPCASRYAGEYPESEPETKAMTELVRREGFDAAVAFHSQGGEIYYDFKGYEQKKARQIAERMAEVSGYKVARPLGSAAFGGFKDWFVKETGGLGFTVEIGRGKNPLPLKLLEETAQENIPLIMCLMREILE